MKTRWMIVSLCLAMLLTAKGLSAGKEESGDKKNSKRLAPFRASRRLKSRLSK